MDNRINLHKKYDCPRESVALAKDAAVQLLERSIRFGHGRLAVVRLVMAVHSGAEIPKEHWLYCQEVAASSKDVGTQALFLEAAQAASSQYTPLHRAH